MDPLVRFSRHREVGADSGEQRWTYAVITHAGREE